MPPGTVPDCKHGRVQKRIQSARYHGPAAAFCRISQRLRIGHDTSCAPLDVQTLDGAPLSALSAANIRPNGPAKSRPLSSSAGFSMCFRGHDANRCEQMTIARRAEIRSLRTGGSFLLPGASA